MGCLCTGGGGFRGTLTSRWKFPIGKWAAKFPTRNSGFFTNFSHTSSAHCGLRRGYHTENPGGSAKFSTANFTTANFLTWREIPPPPCTLTAEPGGPREEGRYVHRSKEEGPYDVPEGKGWCCLWCRGTGLHETQPRHSGHSLGSTCKGTVSPTPLRGWPPIVFGL